MTREQLLALGFTEEQVNQIMAMHGQATQGLRAQVTNLTADLNTERAKNANVQNPNPNPPTDPPTNKELDDALKRIKELESENKRKDIAAYAAEKGLSGEQAENVLKAFGDDVDIAKGAIDSISQIISENRTQAATAKEQEIANKQTNPGGGTAGSGDSISKGAEMAQRYNKTNVITV